MKIKYLLNKDYQINSLNNLYKDFKYPDPTENHPFFSFVDYIINLYEIKLNIFDEDLGCEFIVDKLSELEDFSYNYYNGIRVSDSYLDENRISSIINLLDSDPKQVLNDFREAFSELFDSIKLSSGRSFDINNHNFFEVKNYLGDYYEFNTVSSKDIVHSLLKIKGFKDLRQNILLEILIKFDNYRGIYKFFISYDSGNLNYYTKTHNTLDQVDLRSILVLLYFGVLSKSYESWEIIENNYKNYIK